MVDWDGLRDALRHHLYSSRIEHGAWHITELLHTASASKPVTQGRWGLEARGVGSHD